MSLSVKCGWGCFDGLGAGWSTCSYPTAHKFWTPGSQLVELFGKAEDPLKDGVWLKEVVLQGRPWGVLAQPQLPFYPLFPDVGWPVSSACSAVLSSLSWWDAGTCEPGWTPPSLSCFCQCMCWSNRNVTQTNTSSGVVGWESGSTWEFAWLGDWRDTI